MNKVTIIGAGSVGSTIAYTLAANKVASEIVMIDINNEKVLGEALDIRQGMPFCGSIQVYAGQYPDAVDSDIVIITSGVARKPGQSRLDLAQTNVNIIKSIAPEITKYAPEAIYIIVSNPVDVLTYVFNKCTNIPENHIIGSGTILDTARLKARLAEYYLISQQNIHAYVFGEHGDSSFVPWSLTSISNVPLDKYADSLKGCDKILPTFDRDEVVNYIKTSGAKVIARKGATFYAVSLAVVHLCKSIFMGTDTTMTVSSMMHGEYGIDDVCLSTLSIVGKNGLNGKIVMPLKDEELAALKASADKLKETINSIEI